jgi:hypothetical protein
MLLSQQGLCGLTNPFVTCVSSFGGYFWVGSDSVFRDCLWVKRGCVGWRIHSSPVKEVSGGIFDSAASQFSMTVYESTGAVNTQEKIYVYIYMKWWLSFRCRFLHRQRRSFCCRFHDRQRRSFRCRFLHRQRRSFCLKKNLINLRSWEGGVKPVLDRPKQG